MNQGLYNTSLDQSIQEKNIPPMPLSDLMMDMTPFYQWNKKLLDVISICIDMFTSYFVKLADSICFDIFNQMELIDV